MSLLALLPRAKPYRLSGGSALPVTGTIAGRIRADGRFMVNDAGTFRMRFASALTLLTKDDADCAVYLDWVQRTGFNGIRVFSGHLAWAGQTAASARGRLPHVLEQAVSRGLYVEVTALTDTRVGSYDKREHVRECGAICAAHENALLELANEPWHPTQDDETNNPNYLMGLRSLVPADVLCAVGAPGFDEPDSLGFPTLDYVTLHLDRGRDIWNQVRRVRELEAVSDVTRKPVINNEPIGADEVSKPGSREANPAIFFTLGVLNRIFEVGGVHHSQHGLMAQLPGPNQQACAEAFIRGATCIPTEDRLAFKNARWGDSPVADANFHNPDIGYVGTVVRVYSGVSGGRGFTVAMGLSGDPQIQWKNGWRVVDTIADEGSVRVLEIERN